MNKTVRLPGWLIGLSAPLLMGVLGFLFFHLPQEEKISRPGCVLLVIFNSDISGDNEQAFLPPKSFEEDGLCLKIKPYNACNAKQFFLEVVSGKDFRTIPGSGWTVKDGNYSLDSPDIWTSHQWAVIWDILHQHGKKTRIIYKLNDLSRLSTLTEDDLLILTLPLTDSSRETCLNIRRIFTRISSSDDILIMIQPYSLHTDCVTFRINQWLYEAGFIVLDENGSIDWARSQAFCLNESDKGIRLNKNNVFKAGFLKRFTAEKVKKTLAMELQKISLPERNKPLFKSIMDGYKVCRHKFPEQIPDIILKPVDGIECLKLDLSVSSKNLAIVLYDDRHQSAVSDKGGWIYFRGEPFQKPDNLFDCFSVDITPSILFLWGIPAAEDMNGRIVYPLFKEKWQKIRIPPVASYEIHNFRVRQPFHETIFDLGESR